MLITAKKLSNLQQHITKM